MSRYSQIYIERGKPTADSDRLRIRLGSLAETIILNGPGGAETYSRVVDSIPRDLGVRVPTGSLARFFEKAAIRDVLDAVTVIFRVLARRGAKSLGGTWVSLVAEALAEENMAYRVDRESVIHPFVDAEFEVNRSAALEALTDSRLAEARADFEAAFRHLRNGEGKQAIRMMFPALETACKVLFPGKIARLTPTEVERFIQPALMERYAGNMPAIDAGKGMLRSFKEWINASQPYRHGQEVQEPADPPQDFVIAFLSSGAAFLRWIIEITDSDTPEAQPLP